MYSYSNHTHIDTHVYPLTWLWVVFTSRCLGSNLGPSNHWRRGTTSVRHLCQCCKVSWWDPFCLFNSLFSHPSNICLLLFILLRSSLSTHPILFSFRQPELLFSQQPFLHSLSFFRKTWIIPLHFSHPPLHLFENMLLFSFHYFELLFIIWAF